MSLLSQSNVRPQKYYIRIFGAPKNVAYTMFVHAQKLFGAAIAMHDSTTASIFLIEVTTFVLLTSTPSDFSYKTETCTFRNRRLSE